MVKAYDMVSWNLIKVVMECMGFSHHWINLIMECVSTVNFHLLVNETHSGGLTPKRGLRQGDPLSPYLFILYQNVLSHILLKAEEQEVLHVVKISRGISLLVIFFLLTIGLCSSEPISIPVGFLNLCWMSFAFFQVWRSITQNLNSLLAHTVRGRRSVGLVASLEWKSLIILPNISEWNWGKLIAKGSSFNHCSTTFNKCWLDGKLITSHKVED